MKEIALKERTVLIQRRSATNTAWKLRKEEMLVAAGLVIRFRLMDSGDLFKCILQIENIVEFAELSKMIDFIILSTLSEIYPSIEID